MTDYEQQLIHIDTEAFEDIMHTSVFGILLKIAWQQQQISMEENMPMKNVMSITLHFRVSLATSSTVPALALMNLYKCLIQELTRDFSGLEIAQSST